MSEDLGVLVAKLQADVSDLKKGLRESREELSSFKQLAVDTGAKVKQALAFVGVATGLYEIISQVKEFGREILLEGGKVEVLKGAMYALGQHYEMSAAGLDHYVDKLSKMGLADEKAVTAINQFLKSGLSIDLLPQLAQAAKDLAPTMAMSFGEAFEQIIQGIVKGTPRQLAELVPGIKQAIQALGSETKKIMDSTILTGPEKAQAMLQLVLAAAEKAKGAGDAVADSYITKLNQYKVAVQEAKEGLFELVKPIGMAITKEELNTWEDFYGAVGKNKVALKDLGETVALYVGRISEAIREVAAFVVQYKDLVLILLSIKGILTVMKWTGIAAGAEAISGVLVKLGLLRAALSGPWVLAIAVTLVGIQQALKQAQNVAKYHPEYMGGAEWVPDQERIDSALEEGRKEKYKPAQAGQPSPFGGFYKEKPEVSGEEAKRLAEAAAQQGKLESALGGGGGKGGGKGRGGKETSDNLLAPTLAMYKAKREIELADAQNSLDLLKSTNDKKRSELERALAAQEIDGRTYYRRLQQFQQEETAAALAMIARKLQAQQQAHQAALTELEADEKLSPAAKEIARQKLEAENKKALAKLDVEAKQAELTGAKQVTDELKRQVELRQQSVQKTEDLNLETAQLLGTISDQEAKLQRLSLDWQRAKQEAFKRGATPEEKAALESNYQAKQFDVKYGETLNSVAGEFTSGVTNIINGIRQGTFDIGNALVEMFNNIMMAALKPGFDALGNALTSAVKWLLNSLSGALGGGNIIGGFTGGGGGGGGESLVGVSNAFSAINFGFQELGAGGIAYQPTLAMIAEAGEPEVVSPLSDLAGLFQARGPYQVNIINKTGTEAQGTTQQNDDGSLDIFLEKKVLGMVARGPVHNLVGAMIKRG
jgi:hypothetical protein